MPGACPEEEAEGSSNRCCLLFISRAQRRHSLPSVSANAPITNFFLCLVFPPKKPIRNVQGSRYNGTGKAAVQSTPSRDSNPGLPGERSAAPPHARSPGQNTRRALETTPADEKLCSVQPTQRRPRNNLIPQGLHKSGKQTFDRGLFTPADASLARPTGQLNLGFSQGRI